MSQIKTLLFSISTAVLACSALGLATPAFASPEEAAAAAQASYQVIPAEQAKGMMGQKGVVVLDVRTPEEYAAGHIAGAHNVPLNTLKEGQKLSQVPDSSETILVYCKSGKRAAAASEILLKSGYKKVFNFGGVQNWPYELVK